MGALARSTFPYTYKSVHANYQNVLSFFLTNQILYWTDRTSDPDGWFYKTYDDWDQEIKFS
jgi:hypothetical protein